jgi:hypothetical protein
MRKDDLLDGVFLNNLGETAFICGLPNDPRKDTLFIRFSKANSNKYSLRGMKKCWEHGYIQMQSYQTGQYKQRFIEE